MSINISVTATGSGSLSVGSVSDTQADVTIGSATTVDLVVNNGVGPAGSGNVTLAAGTGISIATADGTSTITATSVVDITTSNLSDLANVNSTAPSTGQVLTYTASNEWAPANVASANHAHDVPTFQEVTNGTATTTSNLNLDPATGVVIVQGGTAGSGSLTLNCEANTHGVTLKGPAHSSNATYSLTLPDGIGTSGQVLSSDGTGFLQWITPSTGTGSGSGGVSWSSVPSSTSSTGTPGDIAYDATYMYVCTTSGWRRMALAGWGQSIIINTQPSNVTTGDATTATFSVNATAPLGSLNYEWQLSTDSGTTWAAISGANGSNYSFTAGLSDDGNQYRVVLSATSATSDEISDVVTLTVAVTNYITTESGDPLDAENGDNIQHDGVGAGTGSGGGGSGGGSGGGTTSLTDLVPADRVSGGAYTMDGPAAPNHIGLGWSFGAMTAGLEFGYNGNMVLAHLGNYNAYLDTTNDVFLDRYLKIYRESSTNNWQPHTNLINALGEKKFIARAATIDDVGNNAAALYTYNTSQNFRIRWATNTGTNFSTFNIKELIVQDVTFGAGASPLTISHSSSHGPLAAYRCSLNAGGNRLGVSIPYKGATASQEGLVRIYQNPGGGGSITQLGNDIVNPDQDLTDSHNTDNWELGKDLFKINTDGYKIVFSSATGTSGTNIKLHRYHYDASTDAWVRKYTLLHFGGSGTTTAALDRLTGISQDLGTVVTRDGKVYTYADATNTWAHTATLTDPTFTHDTNFHLGQVDVNRDGTRVVKTFTNLDAPNGDIATGAVVVYRLEGSTWTQYTNPYYGAEAYENLQFTRISGDGNKVAAAGALPDGGSGTNYRGRIYVWDVPTVSSDNPVISTQPVSDVAAKPPLNQYQDVTFSVTASNESGNAISYQWQYSSNGYSGWTNAPASWPVSYGTYSATPTSSTYTARLANSGNVASTVLPWDGVAWRCILTSGGLTTTSTTAYSYVQYLEVTGTTGGTATFTCNVNVTSNSTATISYQWYELSLPGASAYFWGPINNETGQNIQVTSAGQYKCLVTNTTNGVQILQYGPTNSVN